MNRTERVEFNQVKTLKNKNYISLNKIQKNKTIDASTE